MLVLDLLTEQLAPVLEGEEFGHGGFSGGHAEVRGQGQHARARAHQAHWLQGLGGRPDVPSVYSIYLLCLQESDITLSVIQSAPGTTRYPLIPSCMSQS